MNVADRPGADSLIVLWMLVGSLNFDASSLIHLVAGDYANQPLVHVLLIPEPIRLVLKVLL